MRMVLCVVIIGVAAGVIWYIWASSKPSLLRNEANGPANLRHFKGYKASLTTPVNHGVSAYGETRTGWTTSTFRSGEAS